MSIKVLIFVRDSLTSVVFSDHPDGSMTFVRTNRISYYFRWSVCMCDGFIDRRSISLSAGPRMLTRHIKRRRPAIVFGQPSAHRITDDRAHEAAGKRERSQPGAFRGRCPSWPHGVYAGVHDALWVEKQNDGFHLPTTTFGLGTWAMV